MKITEIIGELKFLSPFNKDLPLEMFCDPSKDGGLSYVLVQAGEGKRKSVLQCGSTSLRDTQNRYSLG